MAALPFCVLLLLLSLSSAARILLPGPVGSASAKKVYGLTDHSEAHAPESEPMRRVVDRGARRQMLQEDGSAASEAMKAKVAHLQARAQSRAAAADAVKSEEAPKEVQPAVVQPAVQQNAVGQQNAAGNAGDEYDKMMKEADAMTAKMEAQLAASGQLEEDDEYDDTYEDGDGDEGTGASGATAETPRADATAATQEAAKPSSDPAAASSATTTVTEKAPEVVTQGSKVSDFGH